MEFRIVQNSDASSNCNARLGEVVRGGDPQTHSTGEEQRPPARLETPCVMVHTTRGCSPHMTWDCLERVQEGRVLAIQADVLHVCDAQQEVYAQDGRSFMGYPRDDILVATPRDPCVYEYIGAVKNSTDDGASIVTMGGARMLSPEDYMALAGYIEADIIIGLGDEIVSDSKSSRVVTSSKRTAAWMGRILRHHGRERSSLVVCPVVGGRHVEGRMDALTHMRSYIEASDGIYVAGLGTGESFREREDILSAIIEAVPAHKMRIASGISHPGDMLQAIACGIDMFDTSYVYMVTRSGYALNFPLHLDALQRAERNSTDGTKLNMWSLEFKRDASPLVHECPCDTCKRHTRAYVHHLLVTHEMTGHVLLEHHNTLYMQEFLKSIRDAIRHNAFAAYMDAWKAYMT